MEKMKRIFRVYYRPMGGHVHLRMFAGYPRSTFALLGELVMSAREFEDFREIAGFQFIVWLISPLPTADEATRMTRSGYANE
jgi:hypothetical protein